MAWACRASPGWSSGERRTDRRRSCQRHRYGAAHDTARQWQHPGGDGREGAAETGAGGGGRLGDHAVDLRGPEGPTSFRTRSTRFKDLAQEIEELYDYKMDQLVDPKQMGDLSVNRFLQRCNELRAKLNRLGISSPEPLRGSSRWRDFLRILHRCVIQREREGGEGGARTAWRTLTRNPRRTATRPTSRHGGADE